MGTGRKIVVAADRLYIDSDVEADGIGGYGSLHAIGSQSPTGETFHREIKPYSELFIPGNREFCERHGYTRERLMDECEELSAVMKDYKEWVDELSRQSGKPPLFVGLNVGFDWAHIDLAFMQSGLENPFGYEHLDLQSLMLPLARDWSWSSTKIDNLPPIIVPQVEFTHHPLEDAQYQQKLHFGMAALLGRPLASPEIS